jgi:hypothetical protein
MRILDEAKKAVETHSAKITAKEFYKMVSENPSVFKEWNTPLEITEYIECSRSIRYPNIQKITHLSKHLTFSGKNKAGTAADFYGCKDLETATGTYHGYVSFGDSGIKKIEDLHITNTDNGGWAACFEGCKNLEVATGTYPGGVNFLDSGIHSIYNLQIEKANIHGNYASFRDCTKLKNLQEWDLSKQIQIEPEKIEAEIKRRQALKTYVNKSQPEELPFL